MSLFDRCRGGLLFLGLLLSIATAARADASEGDRYRFFEEHIRPVLVDRCFECHAEDKKVAGGLRLDTRSGTRSVGEAGYVVKPGRPGKSTLLSVIRGEAGRLDHPDVKVSKQEIRRFRQWIAKGAPDPRGVADRRPNDETDGTHWAYRRPTLPEPPDVGRAGWATSPIDRLILASLEEKGLEPVEDADRRTLIRRLSFDLLGLPPSPAAIDRFLRDDAPGAYERLVDRLLASPHFGERWGRHWLDVARYGESSGYNRNLLYPHAWRYRDYVVEAFNEDKPYDRFVREQVAGDLLPADSRAEADEQTVGTGLLAIGPKDPLEGNDRQFRMDVVDDQINVVSRAVLAQTLHCARCHDHKFDPIKQTEYYALAGIFTSTQPLYGTRTYIRGAYNKHPTELYPLGPNAEKKHEAYRSYRKKLKKKRKALKQAKSDVGNADGKKKKKLRKKVEKLKKTVKQLKENPPEAPPYAMAVRDKKDPKGTHFLKAGNVNRRGDRVPRGFPQALSWEGAPTVDPEHSGRLALAQWLTSEKNPLTARVMANRVWHHLFGRGLVSTVDNFGTTGKKPTHPALLDYLAVRFMRDGWSVKRLIRRIVLSRTYRMSSRPHAANRRKDPDNRHFWRMPPKRLEAEPLRDAMLAVAGRLQAGPPPYGSVTAKIGHGDIARHHDPEDLRRKSTRRTLYLPMVRNLLPEVMRTFDGPSASLVQGDRATTIVPEQSLYLLNDDFVIRQSRHAARRLLSVDGLDRRGRIRFVYRRTLGRPPTAAERRRADAHVEETKKAFEQASQDVDPSVGAWASLFQSLFVSAEFRYVY